MNMFSLKFITHNGIVGFKIRLRPSATAKVSLSHFFRVYDNLRLANTDQVLILK